MYEIVCNRRFASRITHSSFTLIELLAVIGIIIILAGLIMATASYSNRKSLETKTHSQLKQIELALELYKNDFGAFPVVPNDWSRMYKISHSNVTTGPYFVSSPQGLWLENCTTLYVALTGYSTNTMPPAAPTGKNYYLEMKPEQVQPATLTNSAGVGRNINVLVDPYGNPWCYFNTTTSAKTNQFNPRSFDLASFGANPTEPTNSLISNWRQQ